jgi:hypothetical protein
MRRVKKNRSKLFLPIFIIAIMVLSMFGVMIGGISQDDSAFEFNSVNFRKDVSGYLFNVDGRDYKTIKEPREIEYLENEDFFELITAFESGKYSKIYLDVSDLAVGAAVNEIYSNLGRYYNIVLSCKPDAMDEEHCLDLPLKSCDSVEEGVLVVELKISEEIGSSYEQNCYSQEAGVEYLIASMDYFVMDVAGVFDGN